ncbi:MAG: cbb3-type cytochrome c oxidase subunit I [Thiobacillus sp.]|uniref:cbb3-type cytochrome c oxidase subunit I n=1 Tax=Thiobacillus sp. TaxID=924 RepID=UPI002895EFF3|nr:cbb3-type cytochrome c oxidase subunit I [Thiobacillus sp.]MDT3707248.1 cbb3-type cytochrome c oxidase subunit I [Thiobacillus sp.]
MIRIEYETQRLSLRFYLVMLVLFLFQTGFGLLLALQHIDPGLLSGTLNFNVIRTLHLNFAIFWVLCGFIGTILFVGPLLSKRELAAPWLIHVLFYAFLAVVVWNLFTQVLAQQGIAIWWMGQPLLNEGLEYLEAGRIADVVILVGFAILSYVVVRTFPPIKQWNEIHWGLGLGVLALTAVWVFGLFFIERLDLQEYFRWYVVHYWVEGVWEVIHISLVGFLLVLMFKADVKAVGYAVFWGITLVWLSGLLGNAHHYFWIGTPEFWQFWGSLFSALEPLPLIFCFWHIYLDAHEDDMPVENMPAFAFLLGSVVLEQVGAGILGFTMTFALTNVWSHGTWVTTSHAHLALFGTFGMLGIAAAYYAVPIMRGLAGFDQRLGRLAFWLVFTGMLGVGFAFAIGGTVQVFVYRTLGLDWFGGDVAPAMLVAKVLVPVFGFIFAVGVALLVYDLLTLGARAGAAVRAPAATRAATGWSAPLSGWETGKWLLAMWFFGGIITVGLLSFNLDTVQQGSALFPYIMAGIGYPGLLLVTLFFVLRFLRSLEARTSAARAEPPLAARVPVGAT